MVKISLTDGRVGLREFRENTAKYMAGVKAGKKYTVYKNSKPVFAVAPVKEVEYDLDELDGPGWTSLDLTKVRKGGVPAEEFLKILKKIKDSE